MAKLGSTVIFVLPLIILLLDWYSNTLFGLGQDRVIDGFGFGPVIYHFVVLPTKTVVIGNWIRIKKTSRGDQQIEINLDPDANIDFKATMAKVKKKEHHHKHEV